MHHSIPVPVIIAPAILILSLLVSNCWLTATSAFGQDKGNSSVVSEQSISDATANADDDDPLRTMQSEAVRNQKASWGHWGHLPERFSTWLNHSNRLIPVYTFGINLEMLRKEKSVYTDAERLKKLYGEVPDGTINPDATYFDQTDIYRLQKLALEQGHKNVILMIFDGMDWQTTRAASIYKNGKVTYDSGRGTGLSFLDERRMETDFGLIVTSPYASGTKFDVDAQILVNREPKMTGGYNASLGGDAPWNEQSNSGYLIGLDREHPHSVTDSAASATSLMAGIKTYNGAVNFSHDGEQVEPIARKLQAEGYKIGIVTSVPLSHATPAAAYANNVARYDCQDIARDMVGLVSAAHRNKALPGIDVILCAGWGESQGKDKAQGENYAKGNPHFHQDDLLAIRKENGGKYHVVQRTKGVDGRESLLREAKIAAASGDRFLAFYGTKGGHLPFQTADGKFNPTFDAKGTEKYTDADIKENPTLADMTEAALLVLEKSEKGFWLMIEEGDVDWANHANNLDNSIGAVLSGDDAFKTVMDWILKNNAQETTAVIVTSDHGHFFVLDDPAEIAKAGQR